MQVEYATDIIFSNPDELDALHEALKLSAMMSLFLNTTAR